MIDVEVIDDPAVATAALDPIKRKLLAALTLPASAAALAEKVAMPRQKVNYHLRALETHGLVRIAEERKWGGLTERLLIATAASYVVSPDALGALAVETAHTADRLSAGYLIALGARIVREVGNLWRQARKTNRRLATLAIDTEIRFRSPADRAAFTSQLSQSINALVARYHDNDAPGGRLHRLVLVAHPAPAPADKKDQKWQ